MGFDYMEKILVLDYEMQVDIEDKQLKMMNNW